MNTANTKARFWKCALQVNPFSYNIKYRGADHGLTEEKYNQKLVDIALENDIKIIGLADHGSVAEIDAIRHAMNARGIIVFPGFEIASSEKVHFVCLYSEKTTVDELNRYLGNLELLDIEDGVRPSKLSAVQLIEKVEEDQKGFAYAAHCTTGNGILDLKMHHIWRNPLLRAAQIPGDIDDLKSVNNAYWRILKNIDPNYQRDNPIGIINAKDIAKPEDLLDLRASCLIKMTEPCFDAFKVAFYDPESRVRLNSDISEKYYSRLEGLKIIGGYLDGLDIDFSEHLNSVIGGRGTGKSTFLECIRYALDKMPIGINAQKQHNAIIKENLGKTKARVELQIRSSKMKGKSFTVARRYGESASVIDEEGKISSFSPEDLLPDIEIYGQNEIYEIAQDIASQRKLMMRFLESDQQNFDAKINQALEKLAENRQKLVDTKKTMDSIQDQVDKLSKLEEKIKQFQDLGLEDKLKIVPLLETEKQLLKRASKDGGVLDQAFRAIKDSFPDTAFLSDFAVDKLPHFEKLKMIRNVLDGLSLEADNLLGIWQEKYSLAMSKFGEIEQEIKTAIEQEEIKLEDTFKNLPASEGKTGQEIGVEYQKLAKEIEEIRPKTVLVGNQEKLSSKLKEERKLILNELSSMRAERSAQYERNIKKLNKQLDGKLYLSIKAESDRKPLIDFLLSCKLEGVGDGRLSWILDAEDFSPVKLSEKIRDCVEALKNANWGITNIVAEALAHMPYDKILQMEELQLHDIIDIELNIAHDGSKKFRSLNKLSIGQQCTAILHLLLLQKQDPLIVDQPEDNLDNAFIADRIVSELRSAKFDRQFIFATHNANIPVFGDAEWIGIFEANEGQAQIPPELQGGIDVLKVKDMAAIILEGGKSAFEQRKLKYGF